MNYCTYKEAYTYIEESQIFSLEEKEYILYRNAKQLLEEYRK